jgi:hypothetical protein
MTRGLGRLVVAVALVASLGGCATNAGDGNVVDDWGAMASAAPVVPPSGACYPSSQSRASGIDATFSDPIACTQSHAVETVHVGQFPAEVTAVPPLGSQDYWRVFEACEAKAKDFLGGDWYGGRLFLNLTVPQGRQWEGGARWYRCELIEVKTFAGDAVVQRTGSLAGALQGTATVAQGCGTVGKWSAEGTWDDLTPVDCSQAHDAEFAGVFKIPGVDMPTDKQLDDIYDNCWDVLARYTGGTASGIQVGNLVWGGNESGWKRGDHWVRCYAWAGENKKMVGSVKGIGNAAPRSG